MHGITCPRCGRTITQRGASHCGPGSQWECPCGYIEQDHGQGGEQYPNYWTEREAGAAGSVHDRRCVHGVPLNVFCGKCES